jgi:integrase
MHRVWSAHELGERRSLLLALLAHQIDAGKLGLRVSEAVGFRRDELRAIQRDLASRTDALSRLFLSKSGQPLTRQAMNYLITGAAERADLPGAHPHTLGHACALSWPIMARHVPQPGLSRSPRPATHRPLHPNRGPAI